MPEERIIEMDAGHFQNFLLHMTDTGAANWTWTFIEMSARLGVLHSSEQGVLLARPVNSAIPEEDLLAFNDIDPEHPLSQSSLTHEHDTWHILYASGDPAHFFDLAPYELEFVSWHRNKGNARLRKHKFNTIKDKYNGLTKTTGTGSS